MLVVVRVDVVILAVRTNLARDAEVALGLEARGVGFLEGLLQAIYLLLKSLDVLKILVVLGDLRAQLVVNLALLVVDNV